MDMSMMDLINLCRDLTEEEVGWFKPETQVSIYNVKALIEGNDVNDPKIRSDIHNISANIMNDMEIMSVISYKQVGLNMSDYIKCVEEFFSGLSEKDVMLNAMMPYVEKFLEKKMGNVSFEEKQIEMISAINRVDPLLEAIQKSA